VLTRQAKPILSCITVSSDFLSTESAPHSAFMVRQMRHVVSTPPTHTNITAADNADPQVTTGGGGDKMQIKTLIYHSVKNAVSTVLSSTALKTDK